jgi:ankyrin repeat protein
MSFVEAIIFNDLPKVEELIKEYKEKGISVNEPTNYGQNLLLEAYKNMKDDKIFKLLINSGADINTKFKMGKDKIHHEYLIHDAAANRNIEKLKIVIDNGANVNIKDLTGKTALHYAPEYDRCYIGGGPPSVNTRVEIIKMLIAAGADNNITDNNGKKPSDYIKKGKEYDALVGVQKLDKPLSQEKFYIEFLDLLDKISDKKILEKIENAVRTKSYEIGYDDY